MRSYVLNTYLISAERRSFRPAWSPATLRPSVGQFKKVFFCELHDNFKHNCKTCCNNLREMLDTEIRPIAALLPRQPVKAYNLWHLAKLHIDPDDPRAAEPAIWPGTQGHTRPGRKKDPTSWRCIISQDRIGLHTISTVLTDLHRDDDSFH